MAVTLERVVLYKHVNNTTVAIEVLRRFNNDWVRVEWWNIGKCHDPFPMGLIEHIRIPLDEWMRWRTYT